jgi:ApaG protein
MSAGRLGDFSSEAVTHGIRVQVEPRFEPRHSRPAEGRWFFVYSVTIRNESERTVQLVSRHWVITDGNGRVEEVRGPGVVGKQPVLAPGEIFRYSSGCPLTTDVGTMHGSYVVVTESGENLEIEIAPFTLCEPRTIH